jgi:subtilase family serine protease
MRPARIAAAAAGVLLLGALCTGAAETGASRVVSSARPGAPVVVIRPGVVRAESARRSPPSTVYCEKHYRIACYQARQIQRAYQLPALYRRGITGAGQTIVIVDSYGSPTVRHDLAVFDRAEHLPPPPSLRVIEPAGKVPPYRPTQNRAGWAGETDLDVEYAHAIAPGARILVVATPTSENEGTAGFPQIVRAENYVISHHLGAVISQSFSATEQTFPSRSALLRLRSAYTAAARAGVTVLAASGDSGVADVKYDGVTYYLHRVTSWPDSDPLVTGVGGTQLHLAAAGRPRPATVWNDTYNGPTNRYIMGMKAPTPLAGGGGISVIFPRPAYQDGVQKLVGAGRGVPDISMSAACNGAADMYQSFRGQPAGWYPTCGTSEATPEFAGIVALAAQVAGHPIGLVNPALYRMSELHAPGLADVIAGGNTVSFRQGGKLRTIRGFRARPGYDLASGVGTVSAPRFVPELALLAGHPGWSWRQVAATAARNAGVSRAER